MGTFSTQDKVCILLFFALMWTFGTTERLFFRQSSSVTWNEARSRCQACFKDLVTLTPDNIQIIVQNLSSDYWVGLRETFNSKGNSSVFWSRWANGDPLTFQNWLPGQPVFKSRCPKMHCCSCSCTCPAKPTSASFTTTYTTPTYSSPAATRMLTTTVTPVTAECVRTPVEPDDDSDPDDNYIEDACVAMLSFGAWVEKNCSERLPYICYDDRFDGQAKVTDITSTSAAIAWEEGPGDITHYRVEVRRGKQRTTTATNVITNLTTTSLSHQLHNLGAGSHHSVQVFAVKCGRDLNPQNATFYTIPHRVKNLNVSHVTDTSISLSWEKPDGNADIYLIDSLSLTKPLVVETERVDISNLLPGNPYSFSVSSGVKAASIWSDKSNISTYTRPQRVSNLRVSENDDDSMKLQWDLPAGNNTGFLVTVSWNGKRNRTIIINQNMQQFRAENLPSGTEITLGVSALANDTLQGEESIVVNHTAPRRASGLRLHTTATTLNATWDSPVGNDYLFEVELWLNDKWQDRNRTSSTSQYFEGLKTAANYSVFVYSVSGHRRSQPVTEWEFTLPEKPVEVSVPSQTKNQITIKWIPPENAGTSSYHVRVTSDFWGQTRNYFVEDETSFTFENLTSGTRYNLEVRVKAGALESEAVSVSHCTETDEREITLTLMCSSETPLLCDQDGTRATVFDQLDSHLRKLLGDSVSWNLEKVERGNA